MDTPTLVIGNKNYSSWSLRAWMVMAKSEVDFEEVRLPLDTEEFYQRIGNYSEAGLVPVLCSQGWSVNDSLAIAETINEIYCEGRLWPEDTVSRAEARALSAEMHSGFGALRSAMPMNIRARGRQVDLNDALATDIARIEAIWAQGGAGWLFGEFSIADAMYLPVALRFPTYGVELGGAAAEYQAFVLEDEATRRWVDSALEETEIVDSDEAGLVVPL